MGYHRAGFDMTGVDIKPQPRYPFVFIQADALEYLTEHGQEYAAIFASPPCQAFTQMSARWRGKGAKADAHTDLLTPLRGMLSGEALRPYVIENVVGARKVMRATCILHGGMFGLSVYRPRLFESNKVLFAQLAAMPKPCIGVYGDRPQRFTSTRKNGAGMGRSIYLRAQNLEEARHCMGIDWMEWGEITQAVPPAYTQWIGQQLLRYL